MNSSHDNPRGFKKGDIVWSLWKKSHNKINKIEENDFAKRYPDFLQEDMIIHASLMIVLTDTDKKKKTTVAHVIDKESNTSYNSSLSLVIDSIGRSNAKQRMNIKYLRRWSKDTHSKLSSRSVLALVKESIARYMNDEQFTMYLRSLSNQAMIVDQFMREQSKRYCNTLSSVGSTISLMDKNLNKENDKSLNLIPSSTQRKSPTSSSRPAKFPKRKNHQTPVEHKTKITPTEIDESYFSCSSPTTKKFKVYSNDSIIKTKQAKDNDPSEDSPIRIIQTRKTRKTKEALKSNHTEKKLECDFKAKNFGNDAYWTSKHANDTITKVVETVTASLTKRQKLKIKKRNRINSSKKHQRYISALNGNISPPSDADELDLDITVDGRCENIFELSRYDELPDLEDYHPSDTKNSLTLLRKNGLDKRKDDLPIPVTKCNENIQKGQTFSFQGEHHWKSIDIPRITKDIPKKLTSIESSGNMTGKACLVDSNTMSICNEETPDHHKKFPVSNAEILRFLGKRSTKSYLKKIFEEKIPSERHRILRQMFESGKLNFSIYSPIVKLSQIDFLENDNKIDQQLPEILEPVLKSWNFSHMPTLAYGESELPNSQSKEYRLKYIYNVMVPESIVKYLQVTRRWDKEKAEKFFQDGESRVTNDELEDFDKELEEDARRESERRLKEQFDPTDESDSEVSFDVDDESFDLPNIEESTTGGIEIEEKTGYSRSTSKLSRSNLINREKRPYNNSNSGKL